jgi:RNA polymerase sigma factor (sigma-70 family)
LTGEEAYGKYADELMRFATSLVGPSDASDVVSEAVIRCVYGKAWEDVRNPRAYLHRAVLSEARRQASGALRRRVREEKTAPSEAVAAPEVQTDVRNAVRSLSIRQRAVTYLTYWCDLTPADVSSLVGISEGAVKRHLARARSRLRRLLDE